MKIFFIKEAKLFDVAVYDVCCLLLLEQKAFSDENHVISIFINAPQHRVDFRVIYKLRIQIIELAKSFQAKLTQFKKQLDIICTAIRLNINIKRGGKS